MPYNIDPTENPAYNSSSNTSMYYQEWVVLPASYEFEWVQGAAFPETISHLLKIKNYINDTNYNYSNYRVKISVAYSSNTGVEILNLGGNLVSNSEGYDLTTSNLDVLLSISFQGLNLLDVDNYEALITFNVYGVSNSVEYLIDTKTLPIVLNVNAVGTVTVTPNATYFNIVNGVIPDAKVITIESVDSFYVWVPSYYTLSGLGLALDSDNGTTRIYSGTGNTSISIVLNSSVPGVVGSLEEDSIIFSGNVFFKVDKIYRYYSSDDQPLLVYPSSIEYTINEGQTIIDTESVFIVTDEAYSIEPLVSWLNISSDSGNQSEELQLGVVSGTNFSPGVYTTTIDVTSGLETVSIPVTLNVQSVISSTFSSGLNFTKDPNTITMFSSNTNSYVYVNMSIRVYNYASSVFTDVEYNGKIPFFQGKAIFSPGNIVDAAIKKLSSPTDYLPVDLPSVSGSVYKAYRPAVANIILQEYSYDDSTTVLTEKIVDPIYFVKGVTPEVYFGGNGLLEISESIERVTANSVSLVPFVIDIGVYEVKLLVNDTEVSSVYINNPILNTYTYVLAFSDYKQGDIIEVSFNGFFKFSKKFIVFPESINSNYVSWPNEYGLLKIFEFTGELSLSNELEFTTNKLYKNLVVYDENIESTKKDIVTINTGFVIKTSYELITSLLLSYRSWLMNPVTGNLIALNMQTDKLSNKYSDQELYEYDIEFKINPKNVFQVYQL